MKKTLSLNNDWLYAPNYDESYIHTENNDFEKVNLPHANVELPYNYFDEKAFQIVSCYVKTFDHIFSDSEYVTVRFEGVMAVADVYINGQHIGQHLGGYTPFEFEMTPYLKKGVNRLVVKVDSRELPDIPPFGGQIDYLTYGGIYREVSIKVYDGVSFDKVKIETEQVLSEKKDVRIKFDIKNRTKCQKLTLTGAMKKMDGTTLKTFDYTLLGSEEKHDILIEQIEAGLWSLDTPNLYILDMRLDYEDGFDHFNDRFGFRTCEFKSDGFYLNNEPIKIRGLNRHQAFPYVGYAMPKRAQEKDAEILKNELHLNLVRTSHYPQSKHFLNKCDELGLLVFEEIPGWQHIGNKAWQDVAVNHVREMVERDWNHPSIILWGVRINESADNHAFYTETNALSHALDQTRQTGGVRYIENSELLEDVYTMNDFALDGGATALRDQKAVTGLTHHVPYLVTEYNGHMYPTKRFDQEERQMEHVLRHIRVQDASYRDSNISGAIGWCAFDYNTHNDFGSGDRICYHGIMDMFRIEKFAASVYKSQVRPEVEPVLQPVTFWARGERSIGGVLPLIILSNCDYVTLSFGELKTFKLYPSIEYDALPYPPIVVDTSIITAEDIGEWGMKWEDGLVKGYVDGECVIEQKLAKAPLPTNLEVEADDLLLSSSEKDVTRIVVKTVDQYNQLMPFFDRPVRIDLAGPGRIQGPDVVVPKGGAFAFWIETLNKPGTIKLTLTCEGLATRKINIEVE